MKNVNENNIPLHRAMKEVHDSLLKQREVGNGFDAATVSRAINLLETASQRLPFIDERNTFYLK